MMFESSVGNFNSRQWEESFLSNLISNKAKTNHSPLSWMKINEQPMQTSSFVKLIAWYVLQKMFASLVGNFNSRQWEESFLPNLISNKAEIINPIVMNWNYWLPMQMFYIHCQFYKRWRFHGNFNSSSGSSLPNLTSN